MAGTPFNAAQYLLHCHVEEGRGGRVAVRSGSTSTTYEELSSLVTDVSAGLRALGLRRDDRVVLVGSDDVPMLATILGCFHAGLVAVPVSTMLNGSELGKIISDSGARLVFCTSEFVDPVREAITASPDVESVVIAGVSQVSAESWSPVAVTTWTAFLAMASARAGMEPTSAVQAGTDEDNWALWLYTSGTTGLPKAAMHRHANIKHVCETYGKQVLGIRPDDITFSIAKLFFAYGIGNSLFFPFSVGATTVLEPRRPSPAVVQERLDTDKPTLFFGVPTFFAALLNSDMPDSTFSSVRWCASAGEALPAPLQERFTARFGVGILDGLGSTEALHIFLSNRPDDIRPGTTGRPVPGYEVEVRDESGAVAPPGQPGVLFVRGDSIALGYWRRTDATRQVFQGSWLSTGDTYVADAEGYFQCLGRNGDMLKSGGIWVSPVEVESRLVEHPGVREAAVVGVKDVDGLDKPVAVVVADGLTADELIAWCREGLAHFKAPRAVVFVEQLPKTATGKLQRYKLRAQLAVDAATEAGPVPANQAAPQS